MKWIWQKIKEENWILLFLSLLGMFRAMHEISKFRIEWSWLPRWGYPFGLTSPPLDSYHVYGGLFVLILIAGFRLKLRDTMKQPFNVNRKDKKGDYIGITQVGIKVNANRWWETILIVGVEYLLFFYVFDWFYHVIFMLPEFRQWEYVIPFMIK